MQDFKSWLNKQVVLCSVLWQEEVIVLRAVVAVANALIAVLELIRELVD